MGRPQEQHRQMSEKRDMSSIPNEQTLPREVAALPVPSQQQALDDALRALGHAFHVDDQVWIVSQSYDAQHTTWRIDVVRRGGMGRWLRQRYRYDAQAETLYFIGELTLSPAEEREARAGGSRFPVAEWKQK
jgi:hypothetical protein